MSFSIAVARFYLPLQAGIFLQCCQFSLQHIKHPLTNRATLQIKVFQVVFYSGASSPFISSLILYRTQIYHRYSSLYFSMADGFCDYAFHVAKNLFLNFSSLTSIVYLFSSGFFRCHVKLKILKISWKSHHYTSAITFYHHRSVTAALLFSLH